MAIHVTSLAECTQQYDSNNKEKELQIIAVKLLSTKTSKGHTLKVMVANYKLGGGGTKWASINILSVKAAPVEVTEEVPIAERVVTATMVPEQHTDVQVQKAQK